MNTANNFFSLKDFSLSSEIFISCSALQLTVYAISTTYNRELKYVFLNTSYFYIASLISVLTFLLLSNEDLLYLNTYTGNNFIISDYFSFVVKIFLCLFLFLFFIVMAIFTKEEEPIKNTFEYVILILVSILGLLILSSANDLITAYLAIELQSISFYIMAAFKKNSTYSIESGLKYFIIGSLASAFFLFGSTILYGCLGSVNFDDFRMFSSLLFQKENLSENFKNISPFILATMKLLSIQVVGESDVSICPRHSYVVPINWVEKTITSVMLHPFNNSLGNLFLYLSPFFIIEKIDEPSFSLLDYCIEEECLNYIDNILPLEFLQKNYIHYLLHYFNYFDELLFSFFTEEENDTIVNPLIYWFILFENSFSTVSYLSYVYYNQFDFNYYNYYYIEQNNFFKYWNFLTDLNVFETHWVESFYKLNTDFSLILLKNIYLLYHQMSVSSIEMTNVFTVHVECISIGFLFVCVSVFIKLALAPFHYWSLDVYEGSPNKTTAFFAIFPKITLFVLLTRLCYNSFYYIFVNHYQFYFVVLSLLSIFIGSIGGLEQRKIKTLFAYSSLNHTGYILLSFSTGCSEGFHLTIFYLILYMLANMCFWSIYLVLIKKKCYYTHKNNKELGDFVLLRKSNATLAFILVTTLFSIAGIPPIVGFLAKIGVFLVVIKSSIYLIAFISVLLSVVSAFYYIRYIKILYFDSVLVGKLYMPVSTKKALVIVFFFILLLVLCINPVFLYLIVYKITLLLNL